MSIYKSVGWEENKRGGEGRDTFPVLQNSAVIQLQCSESFKGLLLYCSATVTCLYLIPVLMAMWLDQNKQFVARLWAVFKSLLQFLTP